MHFLPYSFANFGYKIKHCLYEKRPLVFLLKPIIRTSGPPNICKLCQDEEETLIHLEDYCPVLRMERQEIFLDKPITNDHKGSIKLLQFIQLPCITEMLATKDYLVPRNIIDIVHTYSSDPDSAD